MEKQKKGVRLEHISKIYNDPKTGKEFYAVQDTTLDIEPGTFVTLLGPSGCGKTTTLRMIAGFESPDEGEIYLGDEAINSLTPNKRDTAMVFQSYALYPHLTVYDNMAFGLKLRKVPKEKIDKAVHEAAKILDIEHLLDRKPKALSGGQRQRVAMGRAIVREPKVFLMDEPLSNLDAKLRVQMRVEISKLHQRLQTTIIYVTHDQTEAMTLGTRIVVMKDGIIQQVDTPQNLYDKPCNLFVAGFMGMPPMNFIDCKVVKSGADVLLMFGSHSIKVPDAKAQKLISGDFLDKEVVLGIRPEDIHDEQLFIESSPESVIDARINIYEMLGAEVYLYFTIDQFDITARVNARTTARPGDTVQFAFDLSKIHIFDKETEEIIIN